MNRKKVILVIVEGPSDEQALGLALSNVFDKNTVRIEVLHRDITSDYDSKSGNIVSAIDRIVKVFLENNKYIKKPDILKIIHIVDTDGTFIPETCVEENKAVTEWIYSDSKIIAPSKQAVIDRNQRKSANLLKLVAVNEINRIPYGIYYMSCNLDVVLYEKYNSSDEEKEQDAYEFAIKYKDDIDGFIKFISKSSFTVPGDYRETWKFIQKDHNSLLRYSNIHLGINRTTSE